MILCVDWFNLSPEDRGICFIGGVAFIPCQNCEILTPYVSYTSSDKKSTQNTNKTSSKPFQKVVLFIGIWVIRFNVDRFFAYYSIVYLLNFHFFDIDDFGKNKGIGYAFQKYIWNWKVKFNDSL